MEAVMPIVTVIVAIAFGSVYYILKELDKRLDEILNELENINGLIIKSNSDRMQDSNKTTSTSST